MHKITWKDECSVGVEELDAHHQEIFKILSKLNEIKDDDYNQGLEILMELQDYVDYHLLAEEKYFKQFNYEGTDEHMIEHNDFRDKIGDLAEKLNTELIAIGEMRDFVADWCDDHITNMDKKYTNCFHEHGLY